MSGLGHLLSTAQSLTWGDFRSLAFRFATENTLDSLVPESVHLLRRKMMVRLTRCLAVGEPSTRRAAKRD